MITAKWYLRKAGEITDAYDMIWCSLEENQKLGMSVCLTHGAWHGYKANIDRSFEKIAAKQPR
jgi:hypothetical protein